MTFSLGERIKTRRKELGLTQKELGSKVLLSEFNISKYERDYSSPDLETIAKLSDALDCTLDYLHGKTNNPNSNVYNYTEDNDNITIDISKDYPYNLTPSEVSELVKLLKSYRFDVDSIIEEIKNKK
ncbi:helix-turn-helix transcriptional regulator [uncultured Clostridium sp.]|uniref:helix-turn-helix domain-containing protein n=1 Tax=uncultured Clostridium sp. TaxID=59620 RepID=UPI0026259409|nr:helix-turn-helix transcriptional regulator [uncultured Clostridium sp.]